MPCPYMPADRASEQKQRPNMLSRLRSKRLSSDINKSINVKGWVECSESNTIILQDFTDKISIIVAITKNDFNNRDVLSVIGILRKKEKIYYIDAQQILILSKCIQSVTTENSFDDFLGQSYQYYHDMDRIEKLKMINYLSKEVRSFLFDNKFIELNNPLLWTSVQEYGITELKVINPFDPSKQYVLPQSPNIQNLLSIIGGIERNFQFNHCFRVDQDKEIKNDSIFEFTQLAIAAAFMSNEEGENLIENLLCILLNKLGENINVPFHKISYTESIKLYNTDKPDFRYKNFYTPLIKIDNNIAFNSLIIPHHLENDVILLLSNNLKKIFGDSFFILYITANNFEVLFGQLKFEYKWNDIIDQYSINKECTIILVDQKNKNIESVFNTISKVIYPKFYGRVPKYKFCWINKYPYIDSRKVRDNIHDKIGQNIFTKIDDELVQDICKNYDKLYTKGTDLVLNGVELASGGEKEHRVEIFIRNLKLLNIKDFDLKYDYFIKALKQGAPPYFSIGIGWERLIWLLLETKYIQEVMIFPKDYNGNCKLTQIPLNSLGK